MLYLVVYVRRIRGIDIDWNVYDPRMIPAATFTGLGSIVWCVLALVCAVCVAAGISRSRYADAALVSSRAPTAPPCPPPGACSFLIGLWPVYGLLSPLVVAVCFMGLIMSTHFIPSI